MVLGYNLTRVINIIGVRAFTDYCARREHITNIEAQSAMAA